VDKHVLLRELAFAQEHAFKHDVVSQAKKLLDSLHTQEEEKLR
jgi:hypothetical protein